MLKCAPLYENGHTIPEISRTTGYPESSIWDVCKAMGIKRKVAPVRNNERYGFYYSMGKVHPHPGEYGGLLLMRELSDQGLGPTAIARELNAKGFQTKIGKVWGCNDVRRTLKAKKSRC